MAHIKKIDEMVDSTRTKTLNESIGFKQSFMRSIGVDTERMYLFAGYLICDLCKFASNIGKRDMNESDIDAFIEQFEEERKDELGEETFKRLNEVAGNGIADTSNIKTILLCLIDPSDKRAKKYIQFNTGIGFISFMEELLEEMNDGFSYYELKGYTERDIKSAAWLFRKTYVFVK